MVPRLLLLPQQPPRSAERVDCCLKPAPMLKKGAKFSFGFREKLLNPEQTSKIPGCRP